MKQITDSQRLEWAAANMTKPSIQKEWIWFVLQNCGTGSLEELRIFIDHHIEVRK